MAPVKAVKWRTGFPEDLGSPSAGGSAFCEREAEGRKRKPPARDRACPRTLRGWDGNRGGGGL